MILAGDIGGTHARLGLFSAKGEHVILEIPGEFPSAAFAGLEKIALQFLSAHRATVEIGCFGIAGPVARGHVRPTNLPWDVDAQDLSRALGAPVVLLNDLEATAYGIAELTPRDFVSLQEGDPERQGNAAVIAAGTGLGEAGLFWDGARHLPFACEGGHCDFAPADALQAGLLESLRKQEDHVSVERVVSGPGLVHVYSFLRETAHAQEPDLILERMEKEDAAAVIASAALSGASKLCEEALDLFVSCYGTEAGNLALKLMAEGGVYIAGGIAPKILPKLRNGAFREAFLRKGRMRGLLERIPLQVVVNDGAALLGAARCAALRGSLPAPGP